MAKRVLKKLKMTPTQQSESLRSILEKSRTPRSVTHLFQEIVDTLQVPFDFIKIEQNGFAYESARGIDREMLPVDAIFVYPFPHGEGSLTVGHGELVHMDKGLSRWLEDLATILSLIRKLDAPSVQPDRSDQIERELREVRGRLQSTLEQAQREIEATKQSSREEIEKVKQESESQVTEIQHQARSAMMEHRLWDELTLLPNARLFPLMLSPMLAHARRSSDLTAVMFLEIGRVDEMMKLHGFDSSDRILKLALERMMKNLREGDIAVRGGENRILWGLGGLHSLEDTATVAEKMLLSLSRPLDVEGKIATLSGSIGISLFPGDGSEPESLIHNAEAALEVARKTTGNSIRFFSKEMNEKVRNYLMSRKELKEATAKQEFALHYQPIVRFSSSDVDSLEALIRWRKPQGPTVYPSGFLGLSEQIGIISQLDEWMIKTACLQRRQWEKDGLGTLRVSVNLSPHFFWGAGVEKIDAILKETGTPPDLLDVEIAERLLSTDVEKGIQRLNDYSALGVNLTIDDFGSSGGSMHLARYNVHAIKLFPVYLRGILPESREAAVVLSTVSLAHNLNVRVIAKAVETQAERLLLESLGCDCYQGNLFSPALPKTLLTEFLRRQQMKPAPMLSPSVEKTQPMIAEEETFVIQPELPSIHKPGGTVYTISCFHCHQNFDANVAEWCLCITADPSVVCPLCGKCFCRATLDYRHHIWGVAPESFWDRKRRHDETVGAVDENPLPQDTKRPLVLIVDDEQSVVRVAYRLIRKLGYSVIVGQNGEEGLQLARSYRPDVVLSDALMPKLDGRDMCTMLKRDPQTSRIKTVIMTAFTGASKYKSSALRDYQFDEQLQKPVEYEKLRSTLQKFLG